MIITEPDTLTTLVHERLPDNWGERFTDIGTDHVTARLPWQDRFAGAETWGTGTEPVVSGPTTMGLADSTMYGCCLAAAGAHAVPVIVTITATYLQPAQPVDIVAVARLVRRGRRLSYLECELRSDSEASPFLHSVATYAIRSS